jgi:hypothetical protein
VFSFADVCIARALLRLCLHPYIQPATFTHSQNRTSCRMWDQQGGAGPSVCSCPRRVRCTSCYLDTGLMRRTLLLTCDLSAQCRTNYRLRKGQAQLNVEEARALHLVTPPVA